MKSVTNMDAKYIHDTLIEGVFFDNDDVLYRAPEDNQAYHKLAAVRAVQEQFPDMGSRQLERLLDKAKQKGKGSLDIFVERFKADAQKLRGDHYKHLIKLTKEFPRFFGHDESAYKEIAQLRIAGINTHIITHGNPEWTEYTTSIHERTLSDFFQNQSYTTKDETPNHSGKEKRDIYDCALDKMGVEANKAVRGQGFAMIEDTMKNLKAAKELGMLTIFINRCGLPQDEVADYVDCVVDTSAEAVQAIIHSNAAHEVKLELEQQNEFVGCSCELEL